VRKTFAAPVSRRALLVVAVTLAAGGILTRRLWQPDGLARSVVDIVKRLFGDDIAPEHVLREFASYYVRTRSQTGYFSRGHAVLTRLYAGSGRLAGAMRWIDAIEKRIEHIEENIGEAFIRNTNMTYRAPDEAIVFAEEQPFGLYVCRNHIARFDYED
jgi:hypothetical protein